MNTEVSLLLGPVWAGMRWEIGMCCHRAWSPAKTSCEQLLKGIFEQTEPVWTQTSLWGWTWRARGRVPAVSLQVGTPGCSRQFVVSK